MSGCGRGGCPSSRDGGREHVPEAGWAVTRKFLGVLVILASLVGVCLGGAVAGTGAAVAACPRGSPSQAPGIAPSPDEPITTGHGTWSVEQLTNAATIVTVGARLSIPPRGWVIAVAAAMQDSSLRNVAAASGDSVGLFQQRPSQGWGSPDQLRDPVYAATQFFTALLTVDGWESLPLTRAAQAVQRSAFPDAYAQWEPDAAALVAALTGTADLSRDGCAFGVSPQGWTQPVHGDVGSGFRTPERPTHDGVDLIVPKGTPIHAAAAGVVTTVRCNAVDVRTGGDWGCDRDGDPKLTTGCGWYVDIEHADHVVTRYCHQLVHPYVTVGEEVTVGQVIGVSGSSGNSSGPHLHFETHLGDATSATAVDPVRFMRGVGAPLG